ncbi:hypothetical protein NOS3756_18430 [Nostoc sp. NIES-3756]|uniref:AAA-like domain-containing protein n=1 Tax=Nostoc sp. NIES-3756 TaxID=1751286 RepID=UPI00071ED333|nr:AAA-like domain-containing protein [Nostoc sp. NIES-3756]BAT52901.1 hypothetical protein NOS3756_18430 [Nostoc sp. NIES-3756]
MKTILILSAHPLDCEPRLLNQEVREVEAALERAKNRDQFQVISKWAVRTQDLQRALLDNHPQIVYFLGHGAGEKGLVLEDESGNSQLVSTTALAKLFELCKESIECVFLNACYSEVQAEAIYEHIDCVVGMNDEIGDVGAKVFAIAFYDALGANRSYEDAYEFGCNALELQGIPKSAIPALKSRRTNQKTLVIKPLSLENPDDGQVPLHSALYITRPPIESDCFEAILTPGALIRIKAPRQMGKSSLMSRILHHAQQQNYQTANLNFAEADAEFLNSLDLFLQWFCASITDNLNLSNQLEEHWQGILGSKSKASNYFQRYLLKQIDTPVVLGLDEVDEIFKHPIIATDFFGLLRAWHERSRNDPTWQKLRLVIVHSKEVYIPLNINQSPFNVGLPVELPELNQSQVQDLVQRHGLNWSKSQLEQLMFWMGGHPYLVRVALYHIARGRMTLEEVVQVAPTEAGPYNDHLRRHLLNLQDDPELLAAIKNVVKAEQPVDVGTVEAFKLRSMGIVKFQGNKIMPLCQLYRQYFRDRLKV